MKDSRADVWILPTADAPADLLAAIHPLLSDDERARAARFRAERDARVFMLAHALVRLVLSRYASIAPAAWVFAANAHGRPFVAEARFASLRFNLSHTDGCAAVIVAAGRDVGVDVEALARRPAEENVARRFFSAAEIDAVRSRADAERHRAFLEIWTLKEAYIKARGVGVALGLQHFTCIPGPGGVASLTCDPVLDDEGARWHMEQFMPTPVHVGAMAIRRDPGAAVEVRLHRLRPSDLRDHVLP